MRAALGIDIGGTNVKWGVVSKEGELLLTGIEETESWLGPTVLLSKLSHITKKALKHSAHNNYTLVGIGIGTAGQVHRLTGIVKGATSSLPGWTGVPLGKKISKETGLPVVVDNDVNMIALGEACAGAGKTHQDFLCVAIGTGIGGCFILNRQIYSGQEGYAGELGHMIIERQGRLCSCGNYGCWEAYASVTGLKKIIEEHWDEQDLPSPIEIFQLAKNQNEKALNIVKQFTDDIVIGLVGLVHLFNPNVIVLAGAIVAGQGNYLVDLINEKLNNQVMNVFKRDESSQPLVVQAKLGGKAGVIGSALSIITSLKRIP